MARPKTHLTDEARREARKKAQKKYRDNNKEKIAKHYQEITKHSQKKKEYDKKWQRETEKGIKSNLINAWKQVGMLCEDWNSLYEIYFHTWNCDYCNKDFENRFERCLDHDHSNGTIRGILCRSCNRRDVLK